MTVGEFQALIYAHLSGEASEDEVRRLFEAINASPENAREFARCALIHAQLKGAFAGERFVDRLPPAEEETKVELALPPSVSKGPETGRKPIGGLVRFVLPALAASLLLAFSLWLVGNDDPREGSPVAGPPGADQPVPTFATIAQTNEVVWNGAPYASQDRLGARVLDFKSGIVSLNFDSGVVVSLEGPARYELLGPDHTRLTAGLLTAVAPTGAEGFRVNTPTARVVDLGTAFGVELDSAGVSHVSVFDGEVEVSPVSGDSSAAGPTLLKQGESARVSGDRTVETTPFDAAPYQKLWPVASGIVRSSGAFRFAPPWPRRMHLLESDTDIFVLPEGYATTLESPCRVDITEPGEYGLLSDLVPAEVSAGTRVRSFFLQFNPVDQGAETTRPRDMRRIVGDITFQQPVLGVIVLGEKLRESDRRFSVRGVRAPQMFRALELRDARFGDRVTLSEDRRTLRLDLAAAGFRSDHVRVLVESPLKPRDANFVKAKPDDPSRVQ